MEASGYKFLNSNGQEQDLIQILKNFGINSIRLRTWVNPSNSAIDGHCSKEETVAMAVRAKYAGMKVMIDFHYSDSWADPSKQNKPAAWQNHSLSQLKTDVYDYTLQVMTALKTAGVSPDWVQIGNEISPGFLLPEGAATDANFQNLVTLLNSGYDAVKTTSPDTRIILHLDRGNDAALYKWWFDNATKYGAKYDVIGLSYYPYWLLNNHNDFVTPADFTESIGDLSKNMDEISQRYNKEVMIVEVGGEDGQDNRLTAAQSEAQIQNSYNLIVSVISKVKNVPNGKGTGVFYWEPEGARSWSQYPLSSWGNDRKPTKVLEAFLK